MLYLHQPQVKRSARRAPRGPQAVLPVAGTQSGDGGGRRLNAHGAGSQCAAVVAPAAMGDAAGCSGAGDPPVDGRPSVRRASLRAARTTVSALPPDAARLSGEESGVATVPGSRTRRSLGEPWEFFIVLDSLAFRWRPTRPSPAGLITQRPRRQVGAAPSPGDTRKRNGRGKARESERRRSRSFIARPDPISSGESPPLYRRGPSVSSGQPSGTGGSPGSTGESSPAASTPPSPEEEGGSRVRPGAPGGRAPHERGIRVRPAGPVACAPAGNGVSCRRLRGAHTQWRRAAATPAPKRFVVPSSA